MGMDRMSSGFDRMGGNMDMGRGFSQYGGGSGHMGGMSGRGAGSKAGCQIFVRNVRMMMSKQHGVSVCVTEVCLMRITCVCVSAALVRSDLAEAQG